MSQIRTDLIWEEQPVMRYVLNDLKEIIEGITQVYKIVLVEVALSIATMVVWT